MRNQLSKTQDDFIDLADLDRDFILLLKEILHLDGYKTLASETISGPGFARSRPDLIMLNPRGDAKTVIELKLYRAEFAPSVLIEQAIERLRAYKRATMAQEAMLVITVPLTHRQSNRFEISDVVLWDARMLASKASNHAALAARFFNLMRAAQVGTLGPRVAPTALTEMMENEPAPEMGAGDKIAAKLEACPSGNANNAASRFEKLCVEALQHLFGNNFAGWKSQAPVERGYHRMDVVARLVPSAPFWSTLAGDFRARYVVFEFKNYKSAINQSEVYTTEKYLFATALRSIAIIIARGGDSESARRTMRGALREQGKLILCLSLAELCKLLRDQDAGADPNNLLIEKLDDMLVGIAR
jgi:hypothetical protein